MARDIDIDIDELERFIYVLQEFQDVTTDKFKASVWHDRQFDQFEPIFDQFIANYRDTEEENEKYIRLIQEEIKISEERNQRLGNL